MPAFPFCAAPRRKPAPNAFFSGPKSSGAVARGWRGGPFLLTGHKPRAWRESFFRRLFDDRQASPPRSFTSAIISAGNLAEMRKNSDYPLVAFLYRCNSGRMKISKISSKESEWPFGRSAKPRPHRHDEIILVAITSLSGPSHTKKFPFAC